VADYTKIAVTNSNGKTTYVTHSPDGSVHQHHRSGLGMGGYTKVGSADSTSGAAEIGKSICGGSDHQIDISSNK
jgi:hypothetical protein